MIDGEDYTLQWQTVRLLKTFEVGADDLERDRDPDMALEECVAFLRSMSDEDKGVTIIDLLVLFSELRSRVLAEQSRKLIEGM